MHQRRVFLQYVSPLYPNLTPVLNIKHTIVKNHAIPESTITQTISASKRFFSLPLSQKSTLDIHKSPNFKGYTALLGENANPENRGDLHEGFDFGWEEKDSGGGIVREGDGAMKGSNVWPEGLDGFRENVLEY